MVETISIYELKPLDAVKNQRLDSKIVRLLEMGCAVSSWEDDTGKKVVGVRTIPDADCQEHVDGTFNPEAK